MPKSCTKSPATARFEASAFTQLHLGCGQRFIKGFFHIDAIDHPHVDVVGPVEDLPYIPDNSAELIYACSVLEHFSRHQYHAVLAEWHRVLKPNGILRLSVPSFEAAVSLYTDNPDYRGDIERIFCVILGGQRDRFDYHNMVFDEALLRRCLLNAGFADCRLWDWQSTHHAHVDDYSQAYIPHMDKAAGIHMALNMEAVKAA